MTSFWSLGGCRRGKGDSQAEKGSAVVLQEVCAHTEVSGSAAHVAWNYKAGCGSWAAQLGASLSWEQEEESTSKEKTTGKRRSQTKWRNMETSQTHSSER